MFRTSIENFFYWGIVNSRWGKNENWKQTRREYFRNVPSLLADFLIRPHVLKSVAAAGPSRYVPTSNWDTLLNEYIADLSTCLGSRQYLFGDRVCEADLSLYGHLGNAYYFKNLSPELHEQIALYPNLVEYLDRIRDVVEGGFEWDES